MSANSLRNSDILFKGRACVCNVYLLVIFTEYTGLALLDDGKNIYRSRFSKGSVYICNELVSDSFIFATADLNVTIKSC